jgi:hypothetical protein
LAGGRGGFEFGYFVSGVRAGFEAHEAIAANKEFKPRENETAGEFEARYAKDDMTSRAIRALLISNGLLTEEGKLDLERAQALGWTPPAEGALSQRADPAAAPLRR